MTQRQISELEKKLDEDINEIPNNLQRDFPLDGQESVTRGDLALVARTVTDALALFKKDLIESLKTDG